MNKKDVITINGRSTIGKNLSPYIIAEIGTNHNRSFEETSSMIREIAKSNCDCVKFQIYEPNEIVSKGIQCSDYGLSDIYGQISAYEMFDKHLKTPKEWFPDLINLAHSLNIDCAVTLHGREGIEWSLKYDFDLIKIASMDHTNLPFLEEIVEKIKVPVLMSTGMANLEDIDLAVDILNNHPPGFLLFYCVAVYPPKIEDISLSNISFMEERYNTLVGFSDHTVGNIAAIASLAHGSVIFEKHVTTDCTLKGPDHSFAIEFSELHKYVNSIKEGFSLINSEGFHGLSKKEELNRSKYLKSIISKKVISAGDILSKDDFYIARPGTGIMPKYFNSIIGREVLNDILPETPIEWSDIKEVKKLKF